MKPSSKNILYGLSSFFLLSTGIPLFAQDENKDTNRPHLKGIRERETNAKLGASQAVHDLLNNPDELFTRLDTDANGQLSREEFLRVINMSSQGAASSQGTRGTKGATGAIGTTGGTGVGGQAGMTGQAPATYGQQPDAKGGQPISPDKQQAGTPDEAAASGQQPVPGQPQPAAPGHSPSIQPQPAPGQEPSSEGQSTAPATKPSRTP